VGSLRPMASNRLIVCSCNILSDRDVREVLAPRSNVRTVPKVYGELECNPKCGRCARSVRRIIDEVIVPISASPH